jgi:hypothetical protein
VEHPLAIITKFNPFTAGHTSDTRESGGVKPIDKIFAHFLITMFERSYLMFSDKSDRLRKNQWVGWDSYLKATAMDPHFLKEWAEAGIDYDACFQTYMEEEVVPYVRTRKEASGEKLDYNQNSLFPERRCNCPRHTKRARESVGDNSASRG